MIDAYDVVVFGAGTSGIAAAVASARNGAKTLLIERSDSIGGSISRAFVYPMMTFHASPQKQVVAGIAQELIDLAVQNGWCPGHVPDMTGTAATITPIEPADFAECGTSLIESAVITVLLSTVVLDLVKSGNKIIGAVVESPAGQSVIAAKVFIDATGNGDIAVAAGADYTFGRSSDNKAQPLTQMFVMSGVNHAEVRAYIANHKEEFVLSEQAKDDLNSCPWLAISGFFSLIRQAQVAEAKVMFRDRVLFFQMKENRASVNMTRILNVDGTDVEQVAEAREQALAQVQECVDVLTRYIPGFSGARLESIAPAIGVRETRHITGDYILTETDVVTGARFADGIACGAFPIDIHSPDGSALSLSKMLPGTYYNIPYRCLLPTGVESLLLAGRCISATHEASASARVSPTSMALGEAAGTAAALSVRAGVMPREVDVSALRRLLLMQGAIID